MTRTLILLTTFLSAFLLFTIQPLYAKFLLPYFGGTSSVWSVSLFFYSFVLLIGYLYASLLISWRSSTARYIHGFLLLITGSLLLSVWLAGGVPPLISTIENEFPAVSVLLTLFAGLGMPIVLLASVSVLMQTLYARLTQKEPYKLYSLSNAGSLIGLASYPFIFEPYFGLKWQALAWTAGFIICVLLVTSVWRQVEKTTTAISKKSTDISVKEFHHKWQIVGMAAVPTFLLVSVTEFLSKGIASFPLLWIIPLLLYLVTFILAFSDRKSPLPVVPTTVFVLLSVLPVLAILTTINSSVVLYLCGFCYFMIFFTLVGTYFHRRVYELRPHTQRLGTFYVLVTLGGAIGSGVVGFVLPVLLNSAIELYISLVLLVLYFTFHRDTTLWFENKLENLQVKILQVLLVCVAGLAIVTLVYEQSVVVSDRNFYGILKVVDKTEKINGEQVVVRSLVNGVTSHGLQAQTKKNEALPASYYGPGSGINIAIDYFKNKGIAPRVSAVGLGAGMVNAYCDSVAQIDYIEINPAVERLAHEYFTYLDMCPEKTSVIIGDGRLVLESKARVEEPYQIIMIDAFTDDAIPVHLLTTEAFANAYKPNLLEGGIVAIHTSNKYLNLLPPINGMAQSNGFETIFISNDTDPSDKLQHPSHWVLLVSKEQKETFLSYENATSETSESIIWTDEKSSVLQAFSLDGSVQN